MGLYNIRISLGQVFFRPFLSANFLNPFCLLIPWMFFFSLNFCLLIPHSHSIPGCPGNQGPSSTLLSIAYQRSLCIDLFYVSAAQNQSCFNQKLRQGLFISFSYIKSTIYMRDKLYLASKNELFIHNCWLIICWVKKHIFLYLPWTLICN